MKSKTNKRNLIYSAVFSFIIPGLGQLYNGQKRKAVLFFMSWFFISYVGLVFFGLQYVFWGISSLAVLSFTIHVFSIIDSILNSLKLKIYTLQKFNRWYLYTLIIFSTFFFSIVVDKESASGIKLFHMPTNGMEPTILVGDYVVADINFYTINSPIPGDLIVFYYPLDTSVSYVKRCIATEGQIVEIKNKVVFVDGVRFPDSTDVQFVSKSIYKKEDGNYIFNNLGSRDNFGPIEIPPNNYFVLGDNRDNSEDSRYWGFVPKENIYGKLLYIYFSWDENKNALLNKIRWSRMGVQF